MLYYERKFTQRGYSLIAGVDEAGRGPLAGPVVSAAVILRSIRFENRINDSKILSASERENAYREIMDKSFFAIGIVNHRVIDKINILQAALLSMRKAIERLSPAPDLVLVDGNVPLSIRIPSENIIGGDGKSLSIACASIVAKVTRDRIMAGFHRIWPEYNYISHKGYGTKEHRDILKAIGPSPIQRLSFRYGL